MADMILTLEGQHFKRYYLLYIIEIIHEKYKYYYIGQTGDNSHTTARPAFRRLVGHLDDIGGSTQNQVYRYLAFDVLDFPKPTEKNQKFNEKIKQAVEDFLVESTVKMYVYRIQPFESGISHEKHLEVVRKVTFFEQIVIALFKQSLKKIGNKRTVKLAKTAECPYPEILNAIKDDFKIK
jgi:hypothetical protein